MSSTSRSTLVESERVDLIDKICKRSYRLRNAMVQSILNHDPFNTDVINYATSSGFVKSRLRKRIPPQYNIFNDCSSDVTKEKLKAFLKGDSMNRKDEIEACETLKSMSEEDLCNNMNLVYKTSNHECSCNTCLRYAKEDFNCDLTRSNEKKVEKNCAESEYHCQNEKTSTPQHNTEVYEYMKYVDCMRVTVQELVLNENGNKKVTAGLSTDKKQSVCGSQTFFIEYELPFIFSVHTHRKTVNKIRNCIKDNSFVRICARRLSTEAILFKQTSIHDIKNVDHINLQGIEMKFQINCRVIKQKNATLVGCAVFSFENFYSSPNLTCIEELPIRFNDKVPIILGKLRILLEMGCGRVYFGRELIATIKGLPESRPLQAVKSDDQELQNTFSESFKKNLSQEKHKKNITSSNLKNGKLGIVASNQKFIAKKCDDISVDKIDSLKNRNLSLQTDTTELIPLVYHDDFLQKIRDNVMIIEFWEKFETKDILFGVTKLPLQQFYFSYRNLDVTRYLAHNKLPLITSDWWESITNPYTDEIVGQVQVLLALGTEQQIKNLKLERGFKVHSVRANFEVPFQKNITSSNKKQIRHASVKKNKGSFLEHKLAAEEVNFKGDFRQATLNDTYDNIKLITKDKAVQADINMSSEHPMKENEDTSSEKLGKLLNQIITVHHQRPSVVEQSTNTDNECNEFNANNMEKKENNTANNFDTSDNLLLPTTSTRTLDMDQTSFSSTKQYDNAPPLVRSTSDLLSSLQAALSIPPTKRPLISANRVIPHEINQELISKHIRTSFKAQIFIKQALHLPIRKRYRGKKLKGKIGKGDDSVKPSCYVTFETMPGLDLKMTPLIPKSTSPTWNYKCDVFLPAELLFNNQKLLIFKVWRKSTNTTMVPNLQSDIVVGFATIDLTVLLSGFPNVQGWFNIIDFSSKCNGQINVHVTPLEDLEIFRCQKRSHDCPISPLSNKANEISNEVEVKKYQQNHQEEQEPDSELLSRALKRKFNELDEITQRLRLRLSHVTNDGSDDENDEVAAEFERDINSLSIEEDFDMANFEKDCPSTNRREYNILGIDCSGTSSSCDTEISTDRLNLNSNASLMIVPTHEEVTKEFEHTQESLSILDRQLLEGKQRIDTLLGKLSLISGDANSFSSRYISGCSATNRSEPGRNDIDTEAILNDLDHHSRPNILASTCFDNATFERIYEATEKGNSSSGSPSSDTSVISNTTGLRAAPDGQGTFSADRDK